MGGGLVQENRRRGGANTQGTGGTAPTEVNPAKGNCASRSPISNLHLIGGGSVQEN